MKNNSCGFTKPLGLRVSVAAVASSLAFLAIPGQVSAAGLGKVVVFSALGQPLRAEIEVNATAAELSGMRAQLASQEAFKQAGLDYTTSLRGITFTLDRRAGKKPVIRVASDTPISEPLVDVLVELNWPTGRLVREYTFLLDPPEVALKNTRVATVPVVSATSSPRQSTVTSSSSSSISEETRARAMAAVQGQGYARIASGSQASAPAMSVKTRTASAPAANTSGAGGDTYVVKQGDTLHKIAGETRPDGVTLEQMLIGLLRANQQAFGGGNMNRLKTGKTLTIPDKGTVESISPREARRIVATQTAEWHAYRSRLASIAAKSPAADSEARQGVAGKITAKVEDRFPEPGESGDQVKVSGSGAGKSGRGQTAGREDAIARDKALKEANERVAMLEQNVAKLQQLLELKDQTLAELQKQADTTQGKSAAPASEPTRPAVVEPPKPALESSAAPTLLAAGSAEPPIDAAQSPTTPTVPASQPETQAQTAVPSAEAQPAAEEPPAPKRPVTPSQPPAPEPGFFESLLEDPMLLAGGGGILALLLGGWLFLRYRKSNNSGQSSLDPLSLSTPSVSGSNLTANSVFRNTGGQSVDTSHTSQTDFSQASPGSIDTEEVDPVEEADVYMAYGRDAQAEEILLEAKRKEPFPTAINLKLLEIYANRKDAKQVDAVAKELYAATGGRGADWEKAVTIGQRFAPENPLFGGGASNSAASMASGDPVTATPRTPPAGNASLQQATAAAASSVSSGSANIKSEASSSLFETTLDMSSLDFDLGAGKTDAAGQAAASATRTQALDFSLDASPATASQTQPQHAAKESLSTSSVLDFSLPESGTDQTPAPKADATAPLANDLEFDVDLTASTFLGNQMPRPDSDVASRAASPKTSPIDMSSIDLNLEATQPVARVMGDGATQSAAVVNPESGVGMNEDVSTKLDLAKAYEEMGDVDGARELLREVAKEGNSEQREKANELLARLGN